MGDTASFRKIKVGFAFLALTVVLAVAGYKLAGWSLIDSIYMVIITVFGVGYGEVHPITSDGLKLFTTLFVVAGCSAGIYVVGGFIQMIAEGEIHQALGVRRMSRGIQQASNHVIVCGFGRVGQILASELEQAEIPFVCVDSDKERILLAEEKGYLVVLGNAGEKATLRQAGIERARVVATVLPDDAANVFITLTVRDIREDVEIIARGESVATQRKLLRSGANHVVLPAAIGASKIANMIACPSAESLLADPSQRERLNQDLATVGLGVVEVRIDAKSISANSKVEDISVLNGLGTLLVAIQRADGTVQRNPTPSEVILAGDLLFFITSHSALQTTIKTVSAKRQEISYRGSKST